MFNKAVWVVTPNNQGGDFVRPYILPGVGINEMGATLELEPSHHHPDVWLVKFRVSCVQ